jgi:hypothetical protein
MTFYLMMSSWMWAATFGPYPSLAECDDAARDAPWYVAATCVAMPAPKADHSH